MKTFILCLVSTTCYLCLPTSGAAQPKPAWPGEPKLSVLQEITKDEKLPELEVVGDFLLKDDLMLVNSIFSSKIVVFQRAKEDGKLQVLGTIDAHEPLWKQSPTIRGQHTFMHMVFGGDNTLYLTGSTFHSTENGRSMGMVWFKVDFKTGKAELLGAQKCPVGNLVMSNDNQALYLLTQFPPGISWYRIDETGTPVHAGNVTGKGLGSTGVMEGKTREGTTSGSLSPDGKFLYNFNDKERAVGWCKTGSDGGLTYSDALEVAGLKNLATVASMIWRISPDGKHAYLYVDGPTTDAKPSHFIGLALFDRNPGSGALAFVEMLKSSEMTDLCFEPNGTFGYYLLDSDRPQLRRVGWFRREPATGKLTFGQTLPVELKGKFGMIHGRLGFDAERNLLYIDGHDSVAVIKTR